MNEELILESLRELLLDPQGDNMPTRKLLVSLIDKELNPIKEPSIADKTHDAFCEVKDE